MHDRRGGGPPPPRHRSVSAAVRALLALGVLACLGAGPLAAGPTAAAPQVSGCAELTEARSGVWTTRLAPEFPVGSRLLTAYAVDPARPTRAVVTNGTVVLRTEDGCRWREVWRASGSADTRVVDLTWHPRATEHVWAAVLSAPDLTAVLPAGLPSQPFGPGSQTDRVALSGQLVHSGDGGRTWERGSTLPQPTGRFAVSPLDPSVGYWPTDTAVQLTSDAGASWTPLPPPVTTQPGEVNIPFLRTIAPDPLGASRLRGNAFYPVTSSDGGLSWTRDGTETGYWAGPYLDGGETGRTRLLTSQADFASGPVTRLRVEGVGGPVAVDTMVEPHTILGQPWSVAWSPQEQRALMATWDANSPGNHPDVSLYLLDVAPDGRIELRDANDLGLGQVGGVSASRDGTFHLFTGSALHTLSPPGAAPPLGGSEGIELDPFPDSTPTPPRPAALDVEQVIDVEPGVAREVDVELALPRRPGPVDVFFLLDTSNSFEPDLQAIASSLADVVTELSRAGIDGEYGVGELGTSDGGRRYRRWADIAPPGGALQRGFEQLRTGGGEESHLIALGQVATGSGVEGTDGPTVAPGQDPTWRPDSLRLLVTVTDVRFNDEANPEAPTREEVYAGLAADGVRALGLEIVREVGDDRTPGGPAAVEAADRAGTTFPTPARADLEELAEATGAFAPAGGLDCSDNGTVEIPAGAPMVCTATAIRAAGVSSLTAVLPRLLLAQEELGSVEVTARGEAAWTWQGTEGTTQRVEGVDLRRDQRLPFTATVGCSPAQEGLVLPMTLAATVRSEVTGALGRVATTQVAVRCGTAAPALATGPEPRAERAEDDPFPGGGAPAPQGQAPAVPPPVPPPVPVIGIAPGTAPGTAPGAAPGTAPGTALGTSPGTAPSSALGSAQGAAHRQRESPLLATLSAEGSTDPTPSAAPWLGLAAAMTGAAGFMARRRSSPAAATAASSRAPRRFPR